MKRLLSHRSAPGLVVAVIAVVLALGGTALATNAGRGSADSGAAKHKKHRQHKAKAVTPKQLHAYVRRYVRHHHGPQGATGATGARGPQGTAGANGTGLVRTVASDPTHLGATDTKIAEAACPAGEVATGGGAIAGDLNPATKSVTPDEKVFVFAQTGLGTGYGVEADNTGNATGDNANAVVVAFAICSPGTARISDDSLVHALKRGMAR